MKGSNLFDGTVMAELMNEIQEILEEGTFEGTSLLPQEPGDEFLDKMTPLQKAVITLKHRYIKAAKKLIKCTGGKNTTPHEDRLKIDAFSTRIQALEAIGWLLIKEMGGIPEGVSIAIRKEFRIVKIPNPKFDLRSSLSEMEGVLLFFTEPEDEGTTNPNETDPNLH